MEWFISKKAFFRLAAFAIFRFLFFAFRLLRNFFLSDFDGRENVGIEGAGSRLSGLKHAHQDILL